MPDSVEVRSLAPTGEPRDGVVLMLPGRGYSCAMPLLSSVSRALRSTGWTVVQAHWELPRPPVAVVAKSLGVQAAPWAARRGYPAAWLTPVLTDPGIAELLTAYPAEQLVVGGTADPFWVRGFLGAGRTLEVDGADHSLELSDPEATSSVRTKVSVAVTELVTAGVA